MCAGIQLRELPLIDKFSDGYNLGQTKLFQSKHPTLLWAEPILKSSKLYANTAYFKRRIWSVNGKIEFLSESSFKKCPKPLVQLDLEDFQNESLESCVVKGHSSQVITFKVR